MLVAAPLKSQQHSTDAAHAAFLSGQYPSARANLSAIVSREPTNAEAAFLLGRVALATRSTDEAVKWLRKAVELNSGEARYHVWLGRALSDQARAANVLRQPSIASDSREHLEKAVQLAPNDIEARKAMSEFYAIAPAFMGGGKQKAREQAAAIKRLDPYQGYLQMAWVLADGNDPQSAEKQLLEARERYPDSAGVVHALADLYLSRLGRGAEGLRLEQEYSVKHPEDSIAQFFLGRAAVISNQSLDVAERALRAYLTRSPRYGEPTIASARFRLGNMFARKGDKASARAEYEAALKLDPGLVQARTALAALK
jgi:tetratricopeptide (TPR) repeat protein